MSELDRPFSRRWHLILDCYTRAIACAGVVILQASIPMAVLRAGFGA